MLTKEKLDALIKLLRNRILRLELDLSQMEHDRVLSPDIRDSIRIEYNRKTAEYKQLLTDLAVEQKLRG